MDVPSGGEAHRDWHEATARSDVDCERAGCIDGARDHQIRLNSISCDAETSARSIDYVAIVLGPVAIALGFIGAYRSNRHFGAVSNEAVLAILLGAAQVTRGLFMRH